MRRCVYVMGTLIAALALIALVRYPGQALIYVLFSGASTALLYFGFRKNAIFFDAFIGVFLWLGFWFKLSVKVAFFDGRFNEPVGQFDGSGAAFDRALVVVSTAFIGLILVSYLRGKYVFNYSAEDTRSRIQHGLVAYYQEHRRVLLTAFASLFVLIAITNAYLGIYQRGVASRTALPYGLGGVYSWLLLFGMASISALLLNLELVVKTGASYSVALLALAESFCSSVSLLSRGMVLTVGALGYGLFRSLQLNRMPQRFRFWAISILAFVILFMSSVFVVNYLRSTAPIEMQHAAVLRSTGALVVDRWVGMEGVLAVSSYPALGWNLWHEAWREVPTQALSIFDSTFISSPYIHEDRAKYNSVSLPGAVAFFYYPGSLAFLFASMLLIAALAAGVEISIFKLGGGNLILCALLSEVVASRYAHFGYAPAQSYLLFGALYLNVFLIYFCEKILVRWQTKKRG